MSEVSYHGWTHRPKALGGTDPIPAAEATSVPGVEWMRSSSTTNWGAGVETDLNFTSINGSWDISAPTFDTNANDNIEINKHGLYRIGFVITNISVDDGSKTYEVRLEFAVVSGELPGGGSVNGMASLNQYSGARLPYFLPGFSSGAGVQFNYPIWYENTFAYEFDQFTEVITSGPAELQVHVLKYEEGVDGIADTAPVVRMFIVRYGDVWVEP